MYRYPANESWQKRFSCEAPDSANLFESFLQHRSVRKFSDREVSETLIKSLTGCAQSSSTSSNLQLYSIISVQDPVRREKIAKLCADQDHVRDAPWFFCFLVDHYRLREAAKLAGQHPDGLDFVEFFIMGVIDVALAAERMVCAAESVGLGGCYIGALRNHPKEIGELLNLPDHVFGLFGLCLGYPTDGYEPKVKPRLASESVWFREEYDHAVHVDEYNRRMQDFYREEGMNAEVTWSMRSGRRVDGHHMTGREVLKDWLEKLGFNRR